MTFPLLWTFSARKWFNLSKWALTRACSWPNICSSVPKASWYIVLQYAKSAIAVFVFPISSVFRYVSLTKSEGNAESVALSDWSNHSCHWRGSTLFLDSFHTGRWSFLDAANSSAMYWTFKLAGATGAAWPVVGTNGEALILHGFCWREVLMIPVEYDAIWEDGFQ